MMKLRIFLPMLVAALIMIVPQIQGSVPCRPLESSTSMDSQNQHSSTPSNDCGSQAHPAPSWNASCSGCGVALLSDQILLPEKESENQLDTAESLAPFDVAFLYWHPPA